MPVNVSSIAPMNLGGPEILPTGSTKTPRPEYTVFTVQDLAQLMACRRRGHLTKWKLAQYNGNRLRWHEFSGLFKGTFDSVLLTHDIILTYLKSVVKGQARNVIAEFA